MNLNPPRRGWFFPIEEAPVLATVTHREVSGNVTVPHKKALIRQVTGWPQLPEDPQPWESDEQAKLDADLEARLHGYFQELGENAYATFNTMTDIASRPPQSQRFRRDRPTLERRAGAWLRDFNARAALPGFSISGHLAKLAKLAE